MKALKQMIRDAAKKHRRQERRALRDKLDRANVQEALLQAEIEQRAKPSVNWLKDLESGVKIQHLTEPENNYQPPQMTVTPVSAHVGYSPANEADALEAYHEWASSEGDTSLMPRGLATSDGRLLEDHGHYVRRGN